MSQLQWALLILGVVAVVAVYLYSRRDRRAMERAAPDMTEPLLAPPKERQLDIFGPGSQQFDEFGVGKPRRVAPSLNGELSEAEQDDLDGAEPVEKEPPRPPVQEKIVSLFIAEREGTHILGQNIHQALEVQGLKFGDRQIYHRLIGDEPVFSVASLLKPGYLDPEDAMVFTTPGLTVFMVLPGPQRPADAIRDMLSTADRLAKELNAQVYDSRKQLLSPAAARALQAEVETWARSNRV